MPKHFVGAPFLTQFDCGPFEIAMILFELAFESGQQRESISGCTREAGQNFVSAFTLYPDQEEFNRDNTLNELEEYFEYKVELKERRKERVKKKE